jgi:acyl-CoA synthetase (AMP-forming)/AMP-acid ligase II
VRRRGPATEGRQKLTSETFMNGWPALWPLRWSDEQRASYYQSGIWGSADLWRAACAFAAQRPAAQAYADSTERLTWGELVDRSAALARGFLDRGIGAGDVIAVQLPNWVEYPLARYATSAAGAVLLSLPPGAGPRHTAHLLRRCGAKVLVTSAEPAPEVRTALTSPGLVISVRAAFPAGIDLASASIDGGQRPAGGDPDSIDLLMGTSGTTGTPKLVMRTPNCFLAMSRSLVRRIGLDHDDTLMITAPIAQGMGYMHGIVEAALSGCRVILLESLRAEAMLDAIERERVTVQSAVPTLAIRLVALPGIGAADTSSLRCHLNGGAVLPPDTARDLEERVGCRILNLYGSLDIGVATMTSPHTDSPAARQTTVGQVVEATEFRLVGPDGAQAGPGEVGEVVIRGANTAVGYFADPEGTAQAFDPEGWGHLGDLGSVDAAGYLRISGRLKDVIIRGGHNVSAPRVESVARDHPAVLDAAAVGYPDPELGERCAIFVVLQAGATLDLPGLTAFFAEQGVPKTDWPERLERVQELPMDTQGKVRKSQLRDRLSIAGSADR